MSMGSWASGQVTHPMPGRYTRRSGERRTPSAQSSYVDRGRDPCVARHRRRHRRRCLSRSTLRGADRERRLSGDREAAHRQGGDATDRDPHSGDGRGAPGDRADRGLRDLVHLRHAARQRPRGRRLENKRASEAGGQSPPTNRRSYVTSRGTRATREAASCRPPPRTDLAGHRWARRRSASRSIRPSCPRHPARARRAASGDPAAASLALGRLRAALVAFAAAVARAALLAHVAALLAGLAFLFLSLFLVPLLAHVALTGLVRLVLHLERTSFGLSPLGRRTERTSIGRAVREVRNGTAWRDHQESRAASERTLFWMPSRTVRNAVSRSSSVPLASAGSAKCHRSFIPLRGGTGQLASHTVTTTSQPSPTSSTDLLRWLEMSMPTSAIVRTASGSRHVAIVPALSTAKRSPP